ncbi:MAG: hypothetical protein IKM46_08475 [Clostridia bacterium]|nr:hypothetical protein [Clostridia bacterium]
MNKKNKKENVKKVITLLINLVISVCVYKLILLLGDKINVMFYYIGVTAFVCTIAVLFCIYYAKNGYTFSNTKITAEDLPSELSEDEKNEFINSLKKKKESASKLLLVILPMILTVFFNYIEMIATGYFAQ